jgi:hypothetical protein
MTDLLFSRFCPFAAILDAGESVFHCQLCSKTSCTLCDKVRLLFRPFRRRG